MFNPVSQLLSVAQQSHGQDSLPLDLDADGDRNTEPPSSDIPEKDEAGSSTPTELAQRNLLPRTVKNPQHLK
ncbi:hypothetical protein BGX21_005717, partial [Mortierella sp. AD011]